MLERVRRGVYGSRTAGWPWASAAFAVMGVAGLLQVVQTVPAFFGDRRLLFTNWDFPAFYAAGRLVASGSGALLYDTTAIGAVELEAVGHPVGGTGVLPFFNPAFFALVFAPLSFLDILTAYQLWTLACLALLAVDVWMLLRMTRGMPGPWRWLLALGFVTMLPVSYGLQHGQFSLILLTSWGAAFLLLRTRRDALAGVALAPLLIKPELTIPVVLYLAWRRRWRPLTTLLPIIAAAVAVSVGVTGIPAALEYPGYLLENTDDGSGVTTATMYGLNGVLAMVMSEPAAPSTRIVLGLMSVAALALVALSDRREQRFAHAWLLLSAVTLLVDPHLYLQDTVLLALPAVAMFADVHPSRRAATGWMLAGGWALLALGNLPAQHLHVNMFAFYVAAVAVGLFIRNNRFRQAARRDEMRLAPTAATA